MEKIETLIDYVRWRGDITFDQMPFNDIDNLALCEISYLDLSKVMCTPRAVFTISDAYDMIVKLDAYSLKTINGGSQDLVEAIAHSKRFGSIRISDYVDILDEKNTQFSAMIFHIQRGLKYIAYRGTDDSIIGWKEDFMLSFTRTLAQELAKDYAIQHVKYGNYYIGGHSKGANLAVYASAYLSPYQIKRVKRIYMNDGPGFCEDVFDLDKLNEIEPFITKIIPEHDIIGQIFAKDIADTSILKSTNKGIYQHDIASWRLDGPNLCTTDHLDPSCAFFKQMIHDWVEPFSNEERETFVNDFFDALSVNGAVSINDITTKDWRDVIEAFMHANPGSIHAAIALPKTALATSRSRVDQILDGIFKWKEDAQ